MPCVVCDLRVTMIYDGIFCVLSLDPPNQRHSGRVDPESAPAGVGPTPGQRALVWATDLLCSGHTGEPGPTGRGHAQGLSSLWKRAPYREHSGRYVEGGPPSLLQRDLPVHSQCSPRTYVRLYSGEMG